jgi:uncharacterized SAM-binding protein YcdF (DUF218 family)
VKVRKWISTVLVIILLAFVPLAWLREPLLTRIGQWLAIERPVEQADLVVALGGDRRRQEEAVRLLHQGLARWILFLGADVRTSDYHCLDVPANRILDPAIPSYTTFDEAMTARTVAQQRGFKSILIVTSLYHERRALWVFKKVFRGSAVGLQVTASPENFSLRTWWKSYIGRKMVLFEYLGLTYYWLTLW